MAIDRSFVQLNRASTERIRVLAGRLNDSELLKPVGKDFPQPCSKPSANTINAGSSGPCTGMNISMNWMPR